MNTKTIKIISLSALILALSACSQNINEKLFWTDEYKVARSVPIVTGEEKVAEKVTCKDGGSYSFLQKSCLNVKELVAEDYIENKKSYKVIYSQDNQNAEVFNLVGGEGVLLENREDFGYLSQGKNVWLFKTETKTKKGSELVWKLSVNQKRNGENW